MSQIGICGIFFMENGTTEEKEKNHPLLNGPLFVTCKIAEIENRSITMTTEENIQNVTNQHIPLREEVERELRMRAWKDEAFRQELIANPKGVIEHLFPQYFPDGKVSDKVTYKVIVEDAYTHHILLPTLPDELTSQMS